MGQKLPQANLATNKLTDSEFIARAQQVHDLMTLNVATFPTLDLPTSLVGLQSQITDYTMASAAAIKGSKAQTAAKQAAKQALILTLKTLALYVTQVAQQEGFAYPGPKYERMTTIIHQSGFTISVNPTKPVDHTSGIPAPIVRRAISESPGTLKILLRQYRNANRNTLLYQVNYRTSAIPGTVPVPAGPWMTQTFTGQNQILLTGLDSGISYDWQVASIGGRDASRNYNKPVNYTGVSTSVII